jgi:hypothetical protein
VDLRVLSFNTQAKHRNGGAVELEHVNDVIDTETRGKAGQKKTSETHERLSSWSFNKRRPLVSHHCASHGLRHASGAPAREIAAGIALGVLMM